MWLQAMVLINKGIEFSQNLLAEKMKAQRSKSLPIPILWFYLNILVDY